MGFLFLHSFKRTIKNWYIPLIVGLLFVILSVIVFIKPFNSLVALSLLFAVTFLFSGITETIFSISNRHHLPNWGWSLAFGLLTFVIGILLMTNLQLSILALSFYIGFLILFRSIAAISFALDIKRYGIKNWVGLLIFGLLGAIFSFILLWNPLFAGMSAVILVAFSFLFGGLFSIFLSFQLRKIHKHSQTISSELQERYDQLQEDFKTEWGIGSK